jgi:Zn-dependent protease
MAPTPSSSSTELIRQPARGIGFSLFGVPVRIASSFWIIAVLFGTQGVGRSVSSEKALLEAVSWTAVVFVSILLHELDHAAAARAFGADPSITLHALGGLTQFEPRGMSRPQRWLVSFTGPAAGDPRDRRLSDDPLVSLDVEPGLLIGNILWVNIGWSLINLLPVLPFDGGRCSPLGPRREPDGDHLRHRWGGGGDLGGVPQQLVGGVSSVAPP